MYMSINDPIQLVYDKKRERWYLLRGRETFYNSDYERREWDTPEEAIEWARVYLNEEVIRDDSGQAPNTGTEKRTGPKRKDQQGQDRLL
jgi:hypothetical protein